MMRKSLFNIMYRLGMPTVLRNLKGHAMTVLNLHRISEEESFFFDPIRPKLFEKIVEYCAKHYEIVSFKDIYKETQKPKLVLSFDDGYYDFMEHAIPILSKYGIPSNHNLVNKCLTDGSNIWTQQLNNIFDHLKIKNITNDELIVIYNITFRSCNQNWITYYIAVFKKLLFLDYTERQQLLYALCKKYDIDRKNKMMNWDDAKLCIDKYGVEIGSHTFHHYTLSTLHTRSEFDLEIGASVKELQDKLGCNVQVLALPNGQYNEDVIEYIKSTHLKYVLFGGDQTMPIFELNDQLNLISSTTLLNNPFEETILRAELFHSKLKKYYRR